MGLVAACLLAPGAASAATTLDFEFLLNGEAGPYVVVTPDGTVTISGSGSNQGVAAFDTSDPGPNAGGEDTDLLVNSGLALILQDDNEPTQTTSGIFDVPDDDANGGTISFVFSQAAQLFSLDLIDINGNGPATVTLTDGGGNSRIYDVPFDWTGDIAQGAIGIQTLDLTTLAAQVGVGPGNPLATASQDAGFDDTGVVQLDVFFAGSAALDNLVFVPEPSTVLLVGLGLGTLALRRRS
ncbi:MAG: PEP-CTERM sorting domain-containing protein [Myxococcota bacterium]